MGDTPYQVLTAVEPVRQASKRALIAVVRGLEREGLLDPPPAVAAAFQDVRYVTPRTRAVYAAVAAKGVAVTLYARGLQSWLAPGVTGIALEDDDALVDYWIVVLPCHQHPVAFAATDNVPGGADGAEPFT